MKSIYCPFAFICKLSVILLFIDFISFEAYGSNENQESTPEEWSDKDFVRLNNTIGSRIFIDLVNNEEGNVLVSPYALTSTLLQIYFNGSEEQREKFQKTFGFPKNSENLLKSYRKVKQSIEIQMINPILFQSKTSLPQGFSTFLKREFDESPQYADFKNVANVKAALNRIVGKKFKGFDEEFFPRKDNSFKEIAPPLLVSAAVSQTQWAGSRKNSREFFENDNKRRPSVKMMTGRGGISIRNFDKFKVIVTENKNIQSGIILPNKDISLGSISNEIKPDKIESFCSNTEFYYTEITIPELKLSFRAKLKDTINSIGETGLFQTNEKDANLFTFSDLIVFYASQFYISEGGSVGSLGTSQSIVINRPFVYFTREKKTGALLFLGRFQPLETD